MTGQISPETETVNLIEDLTWVRQRVRNCRGAIESNQVDDKDVRGSLLRITERLDEIIQRYRGFAQTPAVPDEPWQDDPASDERWNAGLDFAMMQLCDFLGVDPKAVNWDAATETLDGDVQAVLGNILRAGLGEDWGPTLSDTSTDRTSAPVVDPADAIYYEGYEQARSDLAGPKPLEIIQSAADEVVSRVVEWDDRTSPDDFPEALLITPSELHRELVRFAEDIGAISVTSPDRCQVCGVPADLTCGPSRFGDKTWACKDCWEPDTRPDRKCK